MNAWGDTGAAGDSEGGGAGVRSSARMREKNVLCGDGSVMTLLELGPADSLSHASRCGRVCLPLLFPNEGREDEG